MGENSLRYYACGQTRHNIAQVFGDQPSESRIFPSGVFLFQHESGERVLFDTGYAPSMDGTGIKGALYNRLLPPEVTPGDTIDQQLERDNIDLRSIGRVVLSHLHPDHIGGVRYFPEAQFILSSGMISTLASPRLKEGIIKPLLPDWFNEADTLIVDEQQTTETVAGMQGYDMFDDGSFVVVELPGHANGHLGAFVLSRALLAGDAAWGNDLLESIPRMRTVPRTITHDMQAYQQTADKLQKLRDTGVALYFSHDTYETKDLIS